MAGTGIRNGILKLLIAGGFVLLVIRLFYIQVIDNEYKEKAERNVLRYETQYPPRGVIYDRNMTFLVENTDVYDLMVVPRDVKPFDTTLMCSIVGMAPEELATEIAKAAAYSRMRPSVIKKQLPKDVKLRLEERNFPGFYTVYRTLRSYPRKIAGNLLGYVSEVDVRTIENDSYYAMGDYIGKSGVERSYEQQLRGTKGVKVNVVNVHGISQGSYLDGAHDSLPVPGLSLVSTIDADLQALGEELLRGKVGSIVAIEPSTGEILVMASSPTYDPDELVGVGSGNRYMELLKNPRKPLFNRAVMTRYPPGSTFKVVNGLIGLQEGVLRPTTKYSCEGGYWVDRGVKCHAHWSPIDLQGAVQTSCNAYFCHVFRNILDNPKYGNVKEGFGVWERYVRSFGFGPKLDSDFVEELNGYVPSSDFYDRSYPRWNSLTVISLAIGQGELGCSPLQMANLAAIIANRGHYTTPHVVKEIIGRHIDPKFRQRHDTDVDPVHFEPIIEGMFRAVHKDGGTANVAYIPGITVCGKTGTAQNSQGADHSTFMCFAPRENPRIAVSVYIEHGGAGASIAAPIASLIVERYLNGRIDRKDLVQRVKYRYIYYPNYDRQERESADR